MNYSYWKENESISMEIREEGNVYKFDGFLNPFGEFEPTHFADDDSESFYNANWEKIEDIFIK